MGHIGIRKSAARYSRLRAERLPVAALAYKALIEDGARFPEFLVDYGDAAQFLTEQLRPELLKAACEKVNISLALRRQAGYDHSYYFISTFMSDHLHWHAVRLKA